MKHDGKFNKPTQFGNSVGLTQGRQDGRVVGDAPLVQVGEEEPQARGPASAAQPSTYYQAVVVLWRVWVDMVCRSAQPRCWQ